MFHLYTMISIKELFIFFNKILELLFEKIMLCLYDIMISEEELKVM